MSILIIEGNDLIQFHYDILVDAGIGILVNSNSGSCMRNKEIADSLASLEFTNNSLNLAGDINELRPHFTSDL